MHAKPDSRVVLKWMITRSGSVITDVRQSISSRTVMTRFSLRYLSLTLTTLAICIAVNNIGRFDEWDKGEHYMVMDKGFPFEFFHVYEMTPKDSIKPEVHEEKFAPGYFLASAIACTGFSVIFAGYVSMCVRSMCPKTWIVFIAIGLSLVAMNLWHRYSFEETSLIEEKLRLVIGFPLHYYEREYDVHIGSSSQLLSEGWPFNIAYERQIQSPLFLGLNLFFGVMLSFAGAMLTNHRLQRSGRGDRFGDGSSLAPAR